MKDLLIDLDNTVYRESSNIFSQIDKKMKEFISYTLKISQKEAYTLQKKYFLENGTTLRGLMLYHNIEPENFLSYVHDINLTSINKDIVLKNEIKKYKGRKIIFTNGTLEHASRVLKRIDIFEEMDNIFDIKDAEYIPKPQVITYKKVVNKYKLIPHNTIMIDDIKANLITAKKLGMSTILVSTKKVEKEEYIDFCYDSLSIIIKKINNKDILNEN
ncbi:MAG: pyrimidine 5'-nucleotidase [Pseudomonadota bacterium]|nr:pyrimidine 5'-nucleotidase [Pseudomonadota bacterium]